jgi:hypothetical protein
MKNKKLILTTMILSIAVVFSSCTATKTSTEIATDNTISAATIEHDDTIIFVDDDSIGTEDGTSWSNAFKSLQDAISYSQACDEIWVAQGTYYASTDDQTESFSLVDGTDIYGGFEGFETSIDQRNISEHDTILSGDIDKDGTTDGNTDNILLATNGIIDGFIIQDGYNEAQMGPKPGMEKSSDTKSASPQEESGDSTLTKGAGHSSPGEVQSGDAESTPNGAGIVVWGVSATVRNTTIKNCYSIKAGGVYVNITKELETQPLFYNVIFESNSSETRGGGISIDMFSDPTFIDCVFIDNYCGGKGGAMYNDFGCSPSLYNCLFVDNESEMAGAMGNDGVSNSIIYNCTFTGNKSSEQGAAIYQGTGPYNDPIILNSVVSDNESDNGQDTIFNWNESNTAVYNSVIEGGYNGLSSGVIDDTATFDSSYNCTNYNLGYESTQVGNRTEEELTNIMETLSSVENTKEPTLLDTTNKSDIIASSSNIYVDVNGSGNGSSKYNATSNLQEAIYEANNYFVETGDVVTIYLADGIYTPGTDRGDSFTLQAGVKIVGESEENTILSGEIGDNSKDDNSYHVVIGSDNSSLNNLTIKDGYADGADGEVYDRLGGGMLNYAAGNRIIPTYEPTLGFDTELNNVTFTDNYAECGGAIYTYHGGNPTFDNCTFEDNEALYGAATMEVGGCAAVYTDCSFADNHALYFGGATVVDYGSLTSYLSCDFQDNVADSCGGAIYAIDRASQSIINDTSFSTLIDSSWSNDVDIFSTAYLDECTLTNNSANIGNAVYLFEGSYIKLNNTDIADEDMSINFMCTLIESAE